MVREAQQANSVLPRARELKNYTRGLLSFRPAPVVVGSITLSSNPPKAKGHRMACGSIG